LVDASDHLPKVDSTEVLTGARPTRRENASRGRGATGLYRETWIAMVNDPRQRALRVRNQVTGRWTHRSTPPPQHTALRRRLAAVTQLRWYSGAGRAPSERVLRIGCETYVRAGLKNESVAAIATDFRVAR
jgi:hypothetical protein